MKFGVLYELQAPRPWSPDSDQRMFAEALEQIELADRIGIDHAWAVEHHFLEEYSHCSAPEVLLAAASQRTRDIRLGHGVCLTSPRINHPARVAERIATLDVLSGGRVEWGTGEAATALELGGFGMPYDEKRAMWQEGAQAAADMLALTPYPGHEGDYFSMPCRNIVPKPLQRPHPPMWLACARRESILRAARNGMGALVFGFVEPEEAKTWVAEYYDIIRSGKCVPIGHTVNANVAALFGFSVHHDGEEAIARIAPGLRYFGYSLGRIWASGHHRPGRTDVWSAFQREETGIPFHPEQGIIGTPAEVRGLLAGYERAGLDQVIFIQAVGRTRHDHICQALELFGTEIAPAFRERDAGARAGKDDRLAPYVAAAEARRARALRPLREEDIPVVRAPEHREDAGQHDQRLPPDSGIGGALPVPARPGGPSASRRERT
ncbi:LLM class flavin-dependent oxidoreductase [Amycolatopsis rubida]|uniref:Flavin-dependent oxidoreductase, luciferase family (Includes alkanesulfonate monooxygenase SsuD and methylene tetrahydromethanopterin reductase) n=1 Tax=Amycolatopsis rubida TaxID=112413 RepID=A0A1I5ZH68_9PSEU|nr:LLM class flavin-dependent oxidoreductase [Amycolatopsis rubida]SFQ55824.1 Flavin-dependent oxidoreductase, luciferase family (includes alkanesulfonate monooxygenase SsuD and methylene tetrahydromethanopterin reductase) [Amycolatopsis rubida]